MLEYLISCLAVTTQCTGYLSEEFRTTLTIKACDARQMPRSLHYSHKAIQSLLPPSKPLSSAARVLLKLLLLTSSLLGTWTRNLGPCHCTVASRVSPEDSITGRHMAGHVAIGTDATHTGCHEARVHTSTTVKGACLMQDTLLDYHMLLQRLLLHCQLLGCTSQAQTSALGNQQQLTR